jgi:glycosyltransferase involved in cell wall biosynthesis
MSCNTLNLTGNIQPFNEIVNKDISIMVNANTIPINKNINHLIENWGFMNNYGGFEYLEEPLYYDYNIEDYANKMLLCYNKWSDKYSKLKYREYIKQNFTWEKTAKNLINILNEK